MDRVNGAGFMIHLVLTAGDLEVTSRRFVCARWVIGSGQVRHSQNGSVHLPCTWEFPKFMVQIHRPQIVGFLL